VLQEIKSFLTHLHGEGMTEHLWVSICSFKPMNIQFFQSIDTAASHASKVSEKDDVYVGCGLFAEKPKKGRGTATDIAAITSLWLDVDFGESESSQNTPKAKKRPHDEAAARKLMSEMGLRPSMLIHSGHGLHGWWLLKEPWIFEDEDDRQKAATLARGWNTTLQAIATSHGWVVDSVFDLSRVMRIAGTVNRKSDPLDVKIIDSGTQIRYNPSDFDEFLVPEELGPSGPAGGQRKTVIEPVNPVLPRDKTDILSKIETLCVNDVRFEHTWKHKRTDLADRSPSGYDLALANLMVQAGCSDQEVADAIYTWRVMHKQDPEKAMRRDYVMRTISKARSANAAESAIHKMSELSHTLDMAVDTEDQEHRNKIAAANLTSVFGINITRIIKHGQENSIYSLILVDGTDIHIGPIESVMNQNRFCNRIAEATNEVMAPLKNSVWREIVSVMLKASELVELVETTRQEICLQYVRRYISGLESSTVVFTEDEWIKAFTNYDPYYRDKEIWIHAESLRKFINQVTGDKINAADMYDLLRRGGFERRHVGTTFDGVRVSRRYWHLPIGVIEEEETVGETTPKKTTS